jgi:hypothetical protein
VAGDGSLLKAFSGHTSLSFLEHVALYPSYPPAFWLICQNKNLFRQYENYFSLNCSKENRHVAAFTEEIKNDFGLRKRPGKGI